MGGAQCQASALRFHAMALSEGERGVEGLRPKEDARPLASVTSKRGKKSYSRAVTYGRGSLIFAHVCFSFLPTQHLALYVRVRSSKAAAEAMSREMKIY